MWAGNMYVCSNKGKAAPKYQNAEESRVHARPPAAPSTLHTHISSSNPPTRSPHLSLSLSLSLSLPLSLSLFLSLPASSPKPLCAAIPYPKTCSITPLTSRKRGVSIRATGPQLEASLYDCAASSEWSAKISPPPSTLSQRILVRHPFGSR